MAKINCVPRRCGRMLLNIFSQFAQFLLNLFKLALDLVFPCDLLRLSQDLDRL